MLTKSTRSGLPPGSDQSLLPCRVRLALTLRDTQQYERAFITTVALPMRGACEDEQTRRTQTRAVGVLRQGGRRYRGQEQGLALVMTLFVVALVTILVLEYHFDASVEIDLAMNYANDVQAYHLALAGVRFAQALLQQDDPKADGPDDSWYKLGLVPACFSPQQLLELATAGPGRGAADRQGRDTKASAQPSTIARDVSQGDVGCVSLRITDENSKLPINALMPPNGDENQPPPPDMGQYFSAVL